MVVAVVLLYFMLLPTTHSTSPSGGGDGGRKLLRYTPSRVRSTQTLRMSVLMEEGAGGAVRL